ncbi:MAG: gas vesicle protein [Tepidisphaeraceae bacterium]
MADRGVPQTPKGLQWTRAANYRRLSRRGLLEGELTISVAGIDLVYINLRALVASVETARKIMVMPSRRGEGWRET